MKLFYYGENKHIITEAHTLEHNNKKIPYVLDVYVLQKRFFFQSCIFCYAYIS